MSSPQRLQTAVPLDQQSVLPAVRGVPWWGAVLLGTGITGLGAAIDAGSNESLGSIFKFCYLVGCVIAALAVRRRALFTAAAQPPLIAFFVSIVTLYGLNSEQASSGLKSLIFNVLLPIAADFPWMLTTFLVTLALVLARWFLTRDAAESAKRRTPDRDKADRESTNRATTGSGTDRPRARATSHRRAKGAAGAGAPGSNTDAPSASRAEKPRPTEQAQSSAPPAAKSAATRTPAPKTPPKAQAAESGSRRKPRAGVPSDRPSPTPRSASAPRTASGATRPTVADLGAPDLTPSDASPAAPRRSDIPAYESATDIPPAGVADTRS
ncbi:DUF6542 domain-containing protein [Gordonia sp. NPDC058843]|uniref:DUF6542 domain-containing protein n=1 Tax=Gordonia sp. NPDC058843 TaxID=3346648 RepID=UPI0036A911BC